MWWARSELAEVYLGATIVGVRAGDTESWVGVPDVESASSQVMAVLRQDVPRRARVRVWLSAALSRAFVVPADCGARNDDEAVAIAQALAAQATGVSGEITTWVDLWNAQRGCLAAATPTRVLVALREGCASCGLQLRSVKPWWNLALDQALSQARAGDRQVLWSLAEPDALTMGMLSAGAVSAIDTLEPVAHDPDWIHARARARAGQTGEHAEWHAEADLRPNDPQELPIGGWRLGKVPRAEMTAPIGSGLPVEA